MSGEKKPPLPESIDAELRREITEAPERYPDPNDLKLRMETIREYTNELKEEFEIPEGHENSILEGVFKVMDAASYGPAVRAGAAAILAPGKIPTSEFARGYDPRTTEHAPGGEEIAEAAEIPTEPKLGQFLWTPEQVEDMELLDPLPLKHMIPTSEGMLKDINPRSAAAFGIDLLGAPQGTARKLLGTVGKIPGAKELGEKLWGLRTAGKGVQAGVDIASSPTQRLLQAVNKWSYNFPSADRAALEAGKGTTRKVLPSLGERPVTDILSKYNVMGGKVRQAQMYEDLITRNNDEVTRILSDVHAATRGEAKISVPHANKEARVVLYQAMRNPKLRSDAERLLKQMDTEFGDPFPELTEQIVDAEKRATAYARKRIPKTEGMPDYGDAVDEELGALYTQLDDAYERLDAPSLEMMWKKGKGPSVVRQPILDANETKKTLQKLAQKSYPPGVAAKPAESLETQMHKAQAYGHRKEIERTTAEYISPKEAKRLHDTNHEQSILLSGKEGFLQDIDQAAGTGSIINRYEAAKLPTMVGLGTAGSTYYGSSGNVPLALAAGGTAAALATPRGKTYLGKTAGALGKQRLGVGLDQVIRATARPHVESVNPYEELYKTQEKEQQQPRSGRYRLPKESKK
jgi:hypothetical protein